MDIATVFGIAGGLGVIIMAIGPDKLAIFINIPSFMIVIGGTVSTIWINYPLGDLGTVINVLKKTLFYKIANPKEIIPQLIDFGTRARRDGILVLQSATKEINDPFMGQGIQLAIDGAESQMILIILETEVEYIKERHKIGAEMAQSHIVQICN